MAKGEVARLSPLPACAVNTLQEVQPPADGRNSVQNPCKEDREDWMFNRQEFLKLEDQFGPHTLDCCCDKDGLNSQVRLAYCSSKKSFLAQDLREGNLWLNPPFSKAGSFLKHYLRCKLATPSLRATVVLPAWHTARWYPLLRNFRLIKTYPAGSNLFTRPTEELGVRKEIGPTSWPVEVWRDKGDQVEFLPGSGRAGTGAPLNVELIIAQKGRILCRKSREGKIRLPAKCGLHGKNETELTLLKAILQQHQVPWSPAQLKLLTVHQEGIHVVKTYHLAAPPVSLKKGSLQWFKIEDLREEVLCEGIKAFLKKKRRGLLEATLKVGRTSKLFWVSGLVSGRTCKVLLDSGASENFINLDLAQHANLRRKQLKNSIKVTMANGHTSMVEERVDPFEVDLSESKTTVSGLLLPMEEWDVILGRPWLQSVNPAVDWQKLEVRERQTNSLLFRLNDSNVTPTVSLVSAQEAAREMKKKQQVIFVAKIRETEEQATYKTDFGVGYDVKLREILNEFPEVQVEPKGLPPARQWDHKIELETADTPSQPTYRMSPAELAEVQRQLEDLLARGWIRPSESPFGAPILFVRKKDGTLRMCVDYRRLNAITKKDRTPLPRIDDLLDLLGKAVVFSSLDLYKGYHQCRVREEDAHKTAFRTHLGSFEFTVLPFGLTNAPATFQRMMNQLLAPYLLRTCVVYLDDVLVFSGSLADHVDHLRKILQVFSKHQLHINPKKCEFFKKEVSYLGHVVRQGQVTMDPAKISAVKDWPSPTTVREVRGFLGLTGYYQRFISRYAARALPLTELLQKDKVFHWSEPQETAFNSLKEALTSAPVLTTPDVSPEATFTLYTDASGFGIGAVLLQDKGEGLQPVSYYARKLNKHERNYPVHEQELLAVRDALLNFRCYLEGCAQFRVITDHDTLRHFFNQKLLSRRQARWLQLFTTYQRQMEIIYRKGSLNQSDSLSRRPDLYSALQQFYPLDEKEEVETEEQQQLSVIRSATQTASSANSQLG